MKLIVGLGNPGEKYENTRHNLGFDVLNHFFKSVTESGSSWSVDKKMKSDIATLEYTTKEKKAEKVILIKPRTFMNSSGVAVHLMADFYKVEPDDIWIVYDELDLPVGTLKIRNGGSGAGHRGVESILESLGTDKFWRFRLGIGVSHNHEGMGQRKVKDASEFVLERFSSGEAGKVRELIKRADKALTCALSEGLEAAMNQYNSK